MTLDQVLAVGGLSFFFTGLLVTLMYLHRYFQMEAIEADMTADRMMEIVHATERRSLEPPKHLHWPEEVADVGGESTGVWICADPACPDGNPEVPQGMWWELEGVEVPFLVDSQQRTWTRTKDGRVLQVTQLQHYDGRISQRVGQVEPNRAIHPQSQPGPTPDDES